MTSKGKTRRWVLAAAILVVEVVVAGVWWRVVRFSEAVRRAREQFALSIVGGTVVRDVHGRVQLPKGCAEMLDCIEVCSSKSAGGFVAVVFVEEDFKGANFSGRMYVSSPLGPPWSVAAGLKKKGVVDVGDRPVFLGDQIDPNWYNVYYDQD